MRRWIEIALVLACAACGRSESEPQPAATTAASSSSSESSSPLVLARGVRFVHPSSDPDLSKVVRDARAHEAADGRQLLVYVGATWCEPCQRFHKAAAAGQLDDAFPTLSILELDADADRERIAQSGYGSEYIPLFAVPGDDGRGTRKRFSGSVKGDGAVANITPRLRALLAN